MIYLLRTFRSDIATPPEKLMVEVVNLDDRSYCLDANPAGAKLIKKDDPDVIGPQYTITGRLNRPADANSQVRSAYYSLAVNVDPSVTALLVAIWRDELGDYWDVSAHNVVKGHDVTTLPYAGPGIYIFNGSNF